MFIEKTIWRGERLGQLASPVLALLGLATALGIGGVS
jgi:hypothetical protein